MAGAVEPGQVRRRLGRALRVPEARAEHRAPEDGRAVGREPVEHRQLRRGIEQKLLIVLAVDVTQQARKVFQQADRHRPAVNKRAALAVGENLALDQQLAIFDLDAVFLE